MEDGNSSGRKAATEAIRVLYVGRMDGGVSKQRGALRGVNRWPTRGFRHRRCGWQPARRLQKAWYSLLYGIGSVCGVGACNVSLHLIVQWALNRPKGPDCYPRHVVLMI